MFFVVVAHSNDIDTDSSLVEILDHCGENLMGRTPDAGLFFSAIDHDHKALLNSENR